MDHKRRPTEALFPLIAIASLLLSPFKSIMSIGTIDHYNFSFFFFFSIHLALSKWYVQIYSETWKRLGLRSVKVSTLICGLMRNWTEFCSNILSVVQPEWMVCPHRGIRWHPLTILSTQTISAFLQPCCVERATEKKPVLGSIFPIWVNHST